MTGQPGRSGGARAGAGAPPGSSGGVREGAGRPKKAIGWTWMDDYSRAQIPFDQRFRSTGTH
jgi:hypothetical protein